jgi:hypothetical protein
MSEFLALLTASARTTLGALLARRRRWLILFAVSIGAAVVVFLTVCRPEIAYEHSDPVGYEAIWGKGAISAKLRCALLLSFLVIGIFLASVIGAMASGFFVAWRERGRRSAGDEQS